MKLLLRSPLESRAPLLEHPINPHDPQVPLSPPTTLLPHSPHALTLSWNALNALRNDHKDMGPLKQTFLNDAFIPFRARQQMQITTPSRSSTKQRRMVVRVVEVGRVKGAAEHRVLRH